MKLYGLIGNPLTHSFSETYFKNKFQKERISDVDYQLFPLSDINEIIQLLKDKPDLQGFNVTIPFKEKIIPFLNETDDVAKQVGAVNVVRILRKENKTYLKGYNTDVIGFEFTLNLMSFDKKNVKALVLGSGGASKSVIYVLNKLNIPYRLVSRNADKARFSYSEIGVNEMHKFKMIINTTPLGMFPDINICPSLPYKYLTSSHYLIDLIYNPPVTLFLEKGRLKGASIINGIKMLEKQAEESWEIWMRSL